MAVFLAVVAVVAALLHEYAYRFFLRNPPLNALILSVLGLGIALSFRAVLSLDPEVSWIERFRHDDPSVFTLAPPPLLGPLAAILRDPKGRFALSATGMRSVLDGVDSRLDERRDTLRYLIALLIFLGLLGTFWGLLMTATSVGETIRGLNVTGTDPAEMFEKLRAGLEAPLSGMGTAFSTSLFGLASSLVLGFLDLQASQAQNRFANEVEIWLAGLTRGEGAGAWDDETPGPAYLQALLMRTAESFDELQLRLDRTIEESARVHTALRAVGERLAGLTDEIRVASFDDPMRTHLRSLDLTLTQLVEDAARGRDHAVDELRKEIRLLSRTLAALAERER
jgi:hypothetical protein